MSSQDSQPGLSQHTLPMPNEDWRRFFLTQLSVYYGDNRSELSSSVLTRELEMGGLWHRKNLKLMSTRLILPPYMSIW